MKQIYYSEEGSIVVAIAIALVLSITAVSYFMMLGGKTAFIVNQLKRDQAINYAEAALFEAFNRFRTGDLDRNSDYNDTPILIDGVRVGITYTAATGEISATVDYSNVNM